MHMSCVWLYRLYTLSCYSCIPCFYCICNMCPLFSTPSMKLWSKQSFTCPAFSKCWNSTWRQLTMSICLGGACKCGICTMMTNIPSIAFQQSACVDWHHIFAAARANIHSKIFLSPWLVKHRNHPPSSSQDLWMQATSVSNPMACRTGSSQMKAGLPCDCCLRKCCAAFLLNTLHVACHVAFKCAQVLRETPRV